MKRCRIAVQTLQFEFRQIAMEDGPYETFKGSPASEGQLQFDMWGVKPENHNGMGYDWDGLKEKIKVRYFKLFQNRKPKED